MSAIGPNKKWTHYPYILTALFVSGWFYIRSCACDIRSLLVIYLSKYSNIIFSEALIIRSNEYPTCYWHNHYRPMTLKSYTRVQNDLLWSLRFPGSQWVSAHSRNNSLCCVRRPKKTAFHSVYHSIHWRDHIQRWLSLSNLWMDSLLHHFHDHCRNALCWHAVTFMESRTSNLTWFALFSAIKENTPPLRNTSRRGTWRRVPSRNL